MTEQQPEALRLNQWFDEAGGFSQGTKAPHKWVLQADAELRTLRAQVERLTRELYQATNPPFIGKTDSWQAACGKARTERDEARTQVESLQAEVNEQARLNGMGAERELALMAKVEILQAASVEWSPAYTRGQARQSAPAAAVPALVPLTEEQIISAVRPLCNTDQVAERLVAVSIDEYRAIEAAIAKINGLTVGDGAQPIKDAP